MFGNNKSVRGLVICCSVLAMAITAQSASDDVKMRRGGNVGLFPFPRVGRSDPELGQNWEPAMNSMEDYDDHQLAELYRNEIKRQGLIPFPRVGRAGYKPVWFANHPLNNGHLQKRSAGVN